MSDVGSGFCLWLSFTQVTESCNWEPRNWVPGIPGGIFGRTVRLSSITCAFGGLWVVRRTGVGCWAGIPGVHGCLHCGCCLELFGLTSSFLFNCTEVVKMKKNSFSSDMEKRVTHATQCRGNLFKIAEKFWPKLRAFVRNSITCV